jgi:NAD+ synthase (glutamine-hydrolysing)
MKLIKVAAAALNQTPLDWEQNASNIRGAIRAAQDQGASVVCLPELCITGYGCEDTFFAAGTHQTAQDMLAELLPETTGLIVSLGLPCLYRGALYNTACLAVDGQIQGFAAKQNLAGDGIHYEPRWFKSWPHSTQAEIKIKGESYPLGDLVFDCGGLLLGFEICEDAWVANRPGGELARRGVDVILNPSASHFAFDKQEVRKRFILEGSRAFQVGYIYSNLLGNEAGRAIYDGGALIAEAGKFLAVGPRFSYSDFQLTTAVLDVEATRRRRAQAASYRPLSTSETGCVATPFSFPEQLPNASISTFSEWETGPHVKHEEFTRAVALALFDYLRKSRSQGFVVSLSGGADSSAVATLCAAAIRIGTAELGLNALVAKLLPCHDGKTTTADRLIEQLLTCVYQSTRNSSDTTRNSARAVAAAVHASFLEFDVDQIVQDYVQLVSSATEEPIDWANDDIALQNIQARARAPGVWLVANLRNALLLATSNRSEAAVGYTTMDGDTCGGLSPIAGIDKAFLRDWLRWMESDGPQEMGPIPALAAVNVQAPTAELRPPSSGQTDESDLMPYEILDEIERAAIRDKQMPSEVFQLLQSRHADVSEGQLVEWIERFFRLWSQNQWKRERFAPSFHLDDENLDPKTWCRFPILSGGFRRELAKLRRRLGDESVGG